MTEQIPTVALGPEQLPSKLAGVTRKFENFAATMEGRVQGGESINSVFIDFCGLKADNNTDRVLSVGDYTPEELESALTTLSGIEDWLNPGLQSRTYDYLIKARDSKALGELSKQDGGIVDSILLTATKGTQWELSPSDVVEIARATEYGTKGRYGSMDNWFKGGEVAVNNEVIERLRASGIFPKVYTELAVSRVESDNTKTPAEKMNALRANERVLCENILGMSPELSEDFRLGLDGRTMLRDDKGKIIPLDKGGGIDTKLWKETLETVTKRMRESGPDETDMLHKKAGLSAIDYLSASQTERMRVLLSDKPENAERKKLLLDRLRSTNVRVVYIDQYDYSGAMKRAAETFETVGGATRFVGIREETDFVKHDEMLAGLGIIPSSKVFCLHGSYGSFGGGRTGEKFSLTGKSFPKRMPDGTVTSIKIKDYFENFMQADTFTGDREVIMLSCLQAANRDKSGRRVTPTAETMARRSRRLQHVAVHAGTTLLNARTKPQTGDIELLQPDPATPDSKLVSVPLHTTVFRKARPSVRNTLRTGRLSHVTRETVTVIPRR